jgi:lipid A 3-O-deacylase
MQLSKFIISLTSVLLVSDVTSVAARAADMAYPSPAVMPVKAVDSAIYGYEIRSGVFAHGVGSAEKNTIDLGLQIVLPPVFQATGVWWSVLIPRPFVGGMFNTGGRTSSIRGGGLWHFPLTAGWFAEGFFGGAVHDGSLTGDVTHNALGSRVLFDVGGSVGYRFNARWSALATFDHLSNGKTIFGTGFARNAGINTYGVQLSYAF